MSSQSDPGDESMTAEDHARRALHMRMEQAVAQTTGSKDAMAHNRYGEEEIAANTLLALPNPAPFGSVIAWTFPEFTCRCPRSGYPDFATVHLWVQPDKMILELKTLKLYLNSYRDRYGFHEETTARILDDICNAITPAWARIYMDWSPRGNLHTSITRVYLPENYPHGIVDWRAGGESAWDAQSSAISG